jgi:hypothetical protein
MTSYSHSSGSLAPAPHVPIIAERRKSECNPSVQRGRQIKAMENNAI